jgi:transcriptional regulator with PAS, ATPase and Fis domain
LSIAQDLTGAYSGGIILREDANKRKFTVALGLTNKEFNYKLINQIFDNLGKEGIKLNNIYCHPLNSSYKCIGCIYLQDAKHLSENVISVVNIFSDEMAIAIENARQFDSCTDNYPELREELHNNSIICESENHLMLFKRAGKWANKDVPIIYIEGETGTGKEYLAKFIHKKSKRNRKPYKAINCSTIPETLIEPTLFGAKKDSYTGCTEDKIGIFEAANNGVIFLDEFGSMSSSMQAKLLRVFEEKSFLPVGSTKEVQVDIMIICANNESLESLVKKGEFREDLYFRLRQTLLTIPLRNRSQEIPGFINLYLHKLSKQFNSQPPILSKCAIHDLTNNYYYPGNVRNIIEVIEYLVLEYEGKTIDKKIIQSLPMREKLIPKNFSSSSYQVNITLEEVVQQHILNVLINVEIKISKAAKLLDITRDTVHRKMGKLIADTLKKANGDKEKAASLLNIDLKIFENIAKKVKAEVAKNI